MSGIVVEQAEIGARERELPYWRAVNEALRVEMRCDPRVIVLGEDVAGAPGRAADGFVDAWGGPFGLTRGLIQEFGAERVRDTPISESAFVGAAAGAAAAGMRPWVDLMAARFVGVCWDQFLNRLSREHYVTAGQTRLPLVVHTFGSQYSPFVHLPGLKCVVPSDAYTAKGLTLAALRSDDPVVIFGNHRILRKKAAVPEGDYVVPLGRSRTLRDGADITIIGVGAMVADCLAAASELETTGTSAEVIDVLSLEPLDHEALVASASRTGRVVVVDEDTPRCGVARDIACEIYERAYDELRGRIVCVTPPQIPGTFNSRLEGLRLPGVQAIVAACKSLTEGKRTVA